jgi:hypothetical protein
MPHSPILGLVLISVVLTTRFDAGSQASIPPSDRAFTWNPGLNAKGGIPIRTTIYRTLAPCGGDDTKAIQEALDNCPAGHVVKLKTGELRISTEGLV